ncbi:MAG TPA: N-acetylmuramoyl-L-alanine amidase [Actinomycetota bacterium]|nr:N-acetylmuramoyl-L-alanine amidase [Actinomycetota bacterium]
MRHGAGDVRRWTVIVLLVLTSVVEVAAGPGAVSSARAVPTNPDASSVSNRAIPITMTRRLSPSVGRLTPLEFVSTHLLWSWRGSTDGFRYRYLEVGEATPSMWQRVGEHPDEARLGRRGDAESTEHFSGMLAVGRVLAVQWRPLRSGAPVRRVRLDYLNTVDGPLRASAPAPQPTATSADDPRIVTRAEWGADESVKSTSGDCVRRFWPLQQMFVHHTAGSNFDADPAATMRAVYWFHTVRRGWCDIGYNFVIGWDGTIFEGRWARRYGYWETHTSESRTGDVVAGAHVASFNSGSVGISLMGMFEDVSPPPEMRRSLAELLAWEADRHDLDPLGQHTYRNPDTGTTRKLNVIAGHRDAGQTACPGRMLYRALPDIRRDTATAVGTGKSSSGLVLTPSATRAGYGDQITFAGRLTDSVSGAALPLRDIVVYQREGDAPWAEANRASTGADGSFSFAVTPAANLQVVAAWRGEGSIWGSQSELVKVRVHPVIALGAEGENVDHGGVREFPQGTTVVSLVGEVTPSHTGAPVKLGITYLDSAGTYRVVETVRRRLDISSRYRHDFVIPPHLVPGTTFRAVTKFPRDGDHAAGESSPFLFRIDPGS